MGWASLGMKWFAHILGMFVVTKSKFIFVRDDSKTHSTDHPIQVFDRSRMSGIRIVSGRGGFKKLTFTDDQGHQFQFDRIHADNAKKILAFLGSK